MSADKVSREILLAKQPSVGHLSWKALADSSESSGEKPFTQEILSGITIHEITPGPKTSVEHPCFAGKHRWAYLTNGRVACGYCGTPR